ncbi:MAG: response regulator [Bdellovibrionales bacterium]
MMKHNYDLRIMVVDDDAMVREIVVEYLKAFGFTNVLEVRQSARALKNIQDSKMELDLVISDWEMPDPSGVDLLRAIKMSSHRSHVKFIMITSQKSMERVKIAQAASLGCDAYIVKPFRSKILKDKIFQVLGWEEKKVG